jgi:hypothetical protein
MSTEPNHIHDCKCCQFIGGIQHNDKPVDLYYHSGSIESTVIARYSSNGPDYSSGLEFAINAMKRKDFEHPLYKALRLGIEREIIPVKTFHVGLSAKKFDEDCSAYYSSKYYLNMPFNSEEYSDLHKLELDDEKFEFEIDRMDVANNEYKEKWIKEFGALPVMPDILVFFDSEEKMNHYCTPPACESIVTIDANSAKALFLTEDRERLMRTINWIEPEESSTPSPLHK